MVRTTQRTQRVGPSYGSEFHQNQDKPGHKVPRKQSAGPRRIPLQVLESVKASVFIGFTNFVVRHCIRDKVLQAHHIKDSWSKYAMLIPPLKRVSVIKERYLTYTWEGKIRNLMHCL